MAAHFPLFYSDRFLQHDTGAYHPENAGRLTAIVKTLKSAPWADQLDWREPAAVEKRQVLDWVRRLHSPHYVEVLEILAKRGGGHIDSDTVVSTHSYDVALLAVSAWLDGVDTVLQTGHPAFVLARPPGHHALKDMGMGFCLLANAAIAASYALEQPGVQRVAILDWDVHHGNGTQALVETNPRIAYCSLHQWPFYPGTGDPDETGFHHNVLNLPMAPGSTLAEYQPQFEQRIVPFLQAFAPDLLIVSAGYDANYDDPLASICLQPKDFGIFTRYCLGITPKILFGLEGGYDYGAISESVSATIAACLDSVK